MLLSIIHMNGMFSKCETLLVEILCIVMMLNWAYHYLRRSKLTLKIWNLCKQHGRTVGWVRQFTAGTRMLSCHSPITHAQMYRHKILENLAGPVDPYDRSRQLSPSRPISIQYSSQLTNQRPGNGESSGPRTVRCDDTEVSRRRSLTLVQLSCAQWVRLGTELFRSFLWVECGSSTVGRTFNLFSHWFSWISDSCMSSV